MTGQTSSSTAVRSPAFPHGGPKPFKAEGGSSTE